MNATPCLFNECAHPAVPGTRKCSFHKNRIKCHVANCQNQVYARHLCVRHGGKKQCQYEGCVMNARVGNFCSRHGASNTKKQCIEEGCTKMAHAKQKCVRHGGGRKCRVESCKAHARTGGYCCRHTKQVESSTKKERSPIPLPVLYGVLPPLGQSLAAASSSMVQHDYDRPYLPPSAWHEASHLPPSAPLPSLNSFLPPLRCLAALAEASAPAPRLEVKPKSATSSNTNATRSEYAARSDLAAKAEYAQGFTAYEQPPRPLSPA
ncbi:hypothetical protein SPRG_21183 [Saprolegnia parasitica CBS 223.65]|uniref:Uncharacterized protein n=1 Tax=Saprolegnia parasitica (strain CBS 223.65) TaxID=695850 RepID=A0A067BVA9_SAPPC|nr:hypothetical protein SPRG_21183 [Saprolegnia parasitica CBS 223.65]KDO22484.1 hypothetical protein SPRG_21183 [Saprolegnia parasitica CBS 223.65]|eukprot:XP_012206873.1 hypothetical protein SPRG_21183 [Saprolegnia parasitica CBS 223.65]